MNRRYFGIALLLFAVLLAGCQPPESQPAAKAENGDKKLRIAVIPKGTTHEFWKSVHFGAEQAARELGVEAVWLGPQLESDREGQITVVQNFITQQVDGIVLAPLDSQALVASVREAKNAGIPVVIFDSGLDDPDVTVSYVATDNYRGGQLAAEEMARRLNEKGNVILMRYTPGSESTEQREQGFLDKLKEYPQIKVIEKDEYGGTTPEQALDKAQNLLTKYRDQFDGIFAVCEPNATGVLGALEDAQLTGQVVFIGFDPSPRMVQAMAEGKMQGIVLQDPVKMGYLSVKAMVEHLRGQTVDERIVTGEYIATPENMKEDAMHKLLNPAQFE